MNIREALAATIYEMPERYLDELYEIIKSFEATKQKAEPEQSLMAKLRSIKITAPSDFSQQAGFKTLMRK